MGIQNFPASLQPIIQQNFLEREFQEPLSALLGFRSIADREPIPNRIGETVTKTRRGLLTTATTPLNPASNTNFDNGLTPKAWGVEQYVLTMAAYGDTLDLNTSTEGVGIKKQFVSNARAIGEQAARTLDELARNALYSSYIGGNTYTLATLGAPGTTITVDDVRGFETTWDSVGRPVPVSAQNTMTVTIGAGAYTLIGATRDVVNNSTIKSFGGASGTLTFSANVSVLDSTQYNPVIGATAPLVLRPNGRTTTRGLQAGDTFKAIDQLITAASIMRDNGVPTTEDGYYNCFSDNQAIKGLFKDPEFQLLYRGEHGSREWKMGTVFTIGGIRFVPTNMAPQQALGNLAIRRSIICGQGALVEGDFAGTNDTDTEDPLHIKAIIDGITMITRPPMDRLGEIIAQSWKWVGGFTVPTDIKTNPNTIPTANNSAFKRAIVLESL